ncbi:MAG: uncharacterized protein KVP18_004585 [Porospora cf. gigantea A]|uniref:uncharacterized protein n=1 Tax=Porospora cf. gigantea A TaxID=2853593 RepID=UPI00355A662B|nr:MAG: hypothetical protein KVP18_004585 [Porospora cf. gigantea A]
MHVESIVSASDTRVVFYSMKGCRDHYEFSQQNKRMLDSGQNFIAAMSFNVVKRAFLGQYRAVSVLTIDE